MKKLSRSDFEVGQTVYLLRNKDHYDLQNIDSDIRTVVVTVIGRKYLSVNYFGELKFDITNNFQENTPYSPMWCLYLSREAIIEYVETMRLRKIVIDKVNRTMKSISLEDLQEIDNILQKYMKEC